MEPINQAVLEFFTALGFEEIPIEEGLSGLSFEDGPDGEYALITNEDGLLPTSLETPLLIAFYTPQAMKFISFSYPAEAARCATL